MKRMARLIQQDMRMKRKANSVVVSNCEKLLSDLENNRWKSDSQMVKLPRTKVRLSQGDCGDLELYAESIIKYSGSTDFRQIGLMQPLGDIQKVLQDYGIL